MRPDRRVRGRDVRRRVVRHPSSPPGPQDAPGATCSARSRCATRRAGARTPSATARCCSTCTATRRRRRACRRPHTPMAASRCEWTRAPPSLAYPALTGFVIRWNGETSRMRGRRHVPGHLGAERRAAHLRGVRRQRRRAVACRRAHRGMGVRPAAVPTSVTGVPSSPPATAASWHSRSTASTLPRRAASRSRVRPARPSACRSVATRRASRCRRTASAPIRRRPSPSDRSRASMFRRDSEGVRQAGVATVTANGVGAPLDVRPCAELGVQRRRHLDRHGARRARVRVATARRCGTGSCRGQPLRHERRRRGRRVLGPARRRGVPVHACAESWFDDASYGRSTATASVRAQQSAEHRSAGRSSWMASPNCRARARNGSSVTIRRRVNAAEPQPRRVRRMGTRHVGVRSESRHPGELRARRCGARRRRGRLVHLVRAARRTRCRRTGRRRPASAGRTCHAGRTRRGSVGAVGGDHLRQRRSALLRRDRRRARPHRRHVDGARRRGARRRDRGRAWTGRAQGWGLVAGADDVLGDVRSEQSADSRSRRVRSPDRTLTSPEHDIHHDQGTR